METKSLKEKSMLMPVLREILPWLKEGLNED